MPKLVADQNGVIEGRFTVPSGVPAGSALVEFQGNQGSYGSATYTSTGTITNEQRQTTTTATYNYDPLAETFTLNESRHIAGCELIFVNKGNSRVTVQIRTTTVGFPNKNVIAQASIQPYQMKTDGTYTQILFKNPVYLESGVEYAIVILTDDANTSVAVAELGKYDAAHSTWITSQAYTTGVLLSSSNASTWTTHQELDLTFKLLACRFTETTNIETLGVLTADNHTDFLALANVERPAANTDVEFVFTDENGTKNHLAEDVSAALASKVSGEVVVQAKLKGTTTSSPILYPGIQVVLGQVYESADYVTRSLTAGNNVKISAIFEKYALGAASVTVYIQVADGSWQIVPITTGHNVGDNWVECTHTIENFTGAATRLKLVLGGTAANRPKVRNLKVTVI